MSWKVFMKKCFKAQAKKHFMNLSDSLSKKSSKVLTVQSLPTDKQALEKHIQCLALIGNK